MDSKHKKGGMAVLSSNKLDFKTKITTRDKKHFIVKVNSPERLNNDKYV